MAITLIILILAWATYLDLRPAFGFTRDKDLLLFYNGATNSETRTRKYIKLFKLW